MDEGNVHGKARKEALRQGWLSGRLVPVFCGTALRTRGIPPVLEAVADCLPAPAEIPPIRRQNPLTGEDEERLPAALPGARQRPQRDPVHRRGTVGSLGGTNAV